ncbi:MAG: DUF3137 domain-containing protein [Oscillospiraceae bacterium]|nr:DUF3137 domain-containing protein [Oscillospiraceae bacterium]
MDEFEQLRSEVSDRSIINEKQNLDEIRQQLKKRIILSYIISICLIAVGFFVAFKLGSGFAFTATLFLAILFGIIFTRKLSQQYREAFKRSYVRRALEAVLTDVDYDYERGISHDTIAATKMMVMGDRFHSEDYVSGNYHGIGFEQSDVHIEEKHTSRDANGHSSTHYVTIFRGRWMIFDFNKQFRANLQIVQKGFPTAKRKRFFGKKETLFKKVEMEASDFNKQFQVFAQNEHDAFYIITPSFMERIQTLAAHNKGKLMFCLVGNRLHIAIHDRKDSFEPGSVFKHTSEQELMQKIRKEIETITQFVEGLNLENDLFYGGE